MSSFTRTLQRTVIRVNSSFSRLKHGYKGRASKLGVINPKAKDLKLDRFDVLNNSNSQRRDR